MPMVSTRRLAIASLIALSIFPVIVVILSIVQRGAYDSMHETMSNLALGRGGWFMGLAFAALGSGSILLALVLRRSAPGGIVTPGFLTLIGLLTAVSAIFRTDPHGGAPTFHGQVHLAAGLATFGLFVVTLPIAASSFRKAATWRALVIPTLALWSIALATFLTTPVWSRSYLGLGQRLFVATCLIWEILVAARALGADRSLVGPAV